MLEQRLDGRPWIADEYSIADITAFPWVRVAEGEGVELDLPAGETVVRDHRGATRCAQEAGTG